MQLRRRPVFTQCIAHQSCHGWCARGKCDGYGSNAEHTAIWHVSINGEPDGRRSDCRRPWSLNPDALHSHASRTLVARFSQGQSWSDESAIKQQQSELCVGRTDSNFDGWPNECDDRLNHALGVTKLVTPRNDQKPRQPRLLSAPDQDHRVRLSVRYFPDPLV